MGLTVIMNTVHILRKLDKIIIYSNATGKNSCKSQTERSVKVDSRILNQNFDSEQNFDSGTTSRVLATLVTWLGEKTLPVFVVATANDIHSLPVEVVRKGRFDEVFFLGMPNAEERKLI